ncbi:hypothetical protein BH11GEM1_BH11GEM1_02780 [soil metagenome]
MTEEPRALTTSRRSVPEHVEVAVLHALEKLPADRFQTAKEFADALQGHGAALPMRVRTRSGGAIAYRVRPTAVNFPTARFEFDAPPGIVPVT